MKVIVFGATGGVGRQCVLYAIEKGHEVTAFVRKDSVAKLTQILEGKQLKIVIGDVLSLPTVEKAVEGQDVCLVALGGGVNPVHELIFRNTVCSQGTQNIIAAMKKNNVRRIVLCSSMGASDSKQHIPAITRWILRNPLKDKDIQESLVKDADGIDYVIGKVFFTHHIL